MPTANVTLDWALAYARLGWRVFPVMPGGKRPCFAGWQTDATTDPELIRRQWRRSPGPNIGVLCGERFVVFDVEAAHLPALRQLLSHVEPSLLRTPTARTGRGGVHILVAPFIPPSHKLMLDGVHIGELKAGGGFIVAPPSRTKSQYSWIRSPLEVEVAAAPECLAQLVRIVQLSDRAEPAGVLGRAEGEPRLAALARAVGGANEGSRNNLLYWAMRRAIDIGIPPSVAAGPLQRAASHAGLGQAEAMATIDSAMRSLR